MEVIPAPACWLPVKLVTLGTGAGPWTLPKDLAGTCWKGLSSFLPFLKPVFQSDSPAIVSQGSVSVLHTLFHVGVRVEGSHTCPSQSCWPGLLSLRNKGLNSNPRYCVSSLQVARRGHP